jgi:hypothetical protein
LEKGTDAELRPDDPQKIAPREAPLPLSQHATNEVSSAPRSRLANFILAIGPGAIIASLTIGTGELIFSARAGILFGYSILWVFVLLLLFKGLMVYTLSRQLVLTGVHPITRWIDLPGPRGWLPMSLLLAAGLLFPVWVGFHSGVIGTLIAPWTGISSSASGFLILAATFLLVWRGGYQTLEKVQMAIVAGMLLGVLVSLALLRPDIGEMLAGAIFPTSFQYPDWIHDDPKLASIAKRPLWAELGTYVGVIGGSSLDYLAYAAYLRQKPWGNAPQITQSPDQARKDLSFVRIDLLVSFACVLIISTAFVASGHLVLAPVKQIPNDDNMLQLQATFLTRLHPWLYPLYLAGAFLTMLGTLYGTIEVAPAILREWQIAYLGQASLPRRRACILWVVTGGFLVLSLRAWSNSSASPSSGWSLVDIVTPAAIVTGVFMCGIVCWANIWAERKFLEPHLRLPWIGWFANALAGGIFLVVGWRSFLDSRTVGNVPWLPIVLVFGAGTLAALVFPPRPTKASTTT